MRERQNDENAETIQTLKKLGKCQYGLNIEHTEKIANPNIEHNAKMHK